MTNVPAECSWHVTEPPSWTRAPRHVSRVRSALMGQIYILYSRHRSGAGNVSRLWQLVLIYVRKSEQQWPWITLCLIWQSRAGTLPTLWIWKDRSGGNNIFHSMKKRHLKLQQVRSFRLNITVKGNMWVTQVWRIWFLVVVDAELGD